MGLGIMVCGLNGVGKSTFGKELAQAMSFHFIDNEDLFFPQKNNYENSRTHAQVCEILQNEIKLHENFVFTGVKCDYGTELIKNLDYIVHIKVDKEIRLERVRQRSYKKFGERMLKGGD